MKNPKIQITFTSEQVQKLKEISEKSGNSISSIVRNLVADYIEKLEGNNGK